MVASRACHRNCQRQRLCVVRGQNRGRFWQNPGRPSPPTATSFSPAPHWPQAAVNFVDHNYIGLTNMTARAQARCDGLAAKGWCKGAPLPSALTLYYQTACLRLAATGDLHAQRPLRAGQRPHPVGHVHPAYGRFGVEANLCNTSFASVNAATGGSGGTLGCGLPGREFCHRQWHRQRHACHGGS